MAQRLIYTGCQNFDFLNFFLFWIRISTLHMFAKEQVGVLVAVAATLVAVDFVLALKRKRDDKLVRSSLLDPQHSPLQKIIDSRDESSYISTFGVNVALFQELEQSFSVLYDSSTLQNQHTIRTTMRRGRRRTLTSKAALGMMFLWFRSK